MYYIDHVTGIMTSLPQFSVLTSSGWVFTHVEPKKKAHFQVRGPFAGLSFMVKVEMMVTHVLLSLTAFLCI